MKEKIRLIRNCQVNRDIWDSWVDASLNRRIYATSGFLDTFCPGWSALVIDGGKAFMPVTSNRKYGISYLFQPIFIQQLGFFYSDEDYCACLPHFIEILAGSYRYIDISMNETNDLYHTGFSHARMDNYMLRLDNSYSDHAGRYSTNTRRNIIKAVRLGLSLTDDCTPSTMVSMFAANDGRKYPGIRKRNYNRLLDIMQREQSRGNLYVRGARTNTGEIIAAACFLKDFERYVFFFSANTPGGRSQGAMFMLIDSFIREHSGEDMLLDFNGSVKRGLARFYRGFGAYHTTYQRLRINRLFFPANLLKGI